MSPPNSGATSAAPIRNATEAPLSSSSTGRIATAPKNSTMPMP